MSEATNFPVEGQIFIAESGILGKRKRIIYVDLKIGNELEFEKPLTETQRMMSINLIDIYSRKVRDLTAWNCRQTSFYTLYGFCIDHKISVWACFHNKVSIMDAADISNLRVITVRANQIKHRRIFVDKYNKWIVEKYDIKRKIITFSNNMYTNE